VIDTGSMAVIDMHSAPGPVAGHLAVNLACERATQYGIALIGARHYIANSGAMAYYLRRLADAGLIAIMSCNSEAIVCPPGGYKPAVGTNPVGLCVPGEKGAHFIADFATSAIAYGKVLVMKDKGLALPEGLIVDSNGYPSTNPEDAMAGAIKPLADYRGFALALMIEMIAGPLIGAMACKRVAGKDGLFIIAIDPAKMGHSHFAASITPILDSIRTSPPAPGSGAVTLPGDRSRTILKNTLAAGMVDVADKTLEKLKALA
jgi:LDH2 family malate/lactate/ureidoglycolate dehydrogenase